MAKDTSFYKKYLWNCAGKIIAPDFPIVMGILNVTPDSFYDGGKYNEDEKIIERVRTMLGEGAFIIDVGACSTRPGAKDVPEEEERERMTGTIRLIKKNFPDALISADTYRSKVALAAAGEGASIINDVSGGTIDRDMFDAAAQTRLPYVLSHIQGIPGSMQQPSYKKVTKEVMAFLAEKIAHLKAKGVNDIIVDPGFGFGKELEHNYELLNNLAYLKLFDFPILVGFSRKSMVNKVLGTSPQNSLNGTTVLNVMALLKGASILRVHDVKEAKEAIKIVKYSQSISQNS